MKRIAGIYVPGLGDHRTLGQDDAVKGFAKYGLDIKYLPIGWSNGSFDKKLAKINKNVDELYKQFGPVALVGTSAGASAVLNAYASNKSKVRAVVCISGKIQNPSNVSTSIYKHSPAFKQSLDMLQKNLKKLDTSDKHKILTTHAFYDRLIPKAETEIPDTKSLEVPMIGHVPGILLTLLAYKKPIAGFICSR